MVARSRPFAFHVCAHADADDDDDDDDARARRVVGCARVTFVDVGCCVLTVRARRIEGDAGPATGD